MSTNAAPKRDINVKERTPIGHYFLYWEAILAYILIAFNILLFVTSGHLIQDTGTYAGIIQTGMDLSFMAVGMYLIVTFGDIDPSCANVMTFSAMTIGYTYGATNNAFISVVAGLAVSMACELFNGCIIAFFDLPAMIVGISTGMLYSGIVQIIMAGGVIRTFPEWFKAFAWNNVFGNLIPISLLTLIIVVALFYFFIHKTRFGRVFTMVGTNRIAAAYSGISVTRTRIIGYLIMGVMITISAVCMVGRTGNGLNQTFGETYSLDVIAITMLASVTIRGRKARVTAVVLSALIMTFIKYSLGLLAVEPNVRRLVIGAILIISVLIPSINAQVFANIKLKWVYKYNKNLEATYVNAAAAVKAAKAELKASKKDGTFTAAKQDEITNRIASIIQERDTTAAAIRAEMAEEAAKNKTAKASK